MRPVIDLLAAIQKGDQRALRQLYDSESKRLFAIALRITGRHDLAADAVQEAFVQVWENAGKFRAERGSVQAWLTGIVRYRALDLRRQQQNAPPDIAAEPSTDAEFPEHLTQDALFRCLGALDANQRQTVMLAFVEGFSHSEIATRLAAPLGTVKSWARRALLSLRGCLES